MNQQKNHQLQPNSPDQRIIGCLLGQAIGDALGARYEFSKSKNATYQILQDSINNHVPLLGEGPHDLLQGQITDDTELALALARSLVAEHRFSITHIANAYSRWFHSHPFDCGRFSGRSRRTTSHAMIDTHPKHDDLVNYQIMKESSATKNQESLSNGCLMRISPLAIAGLHWTPHQLIQAAKLDCELTNPNPIAVDAVSVYVIALQTLMLTGDHHKAYYNSLLFAETEIVQDLITSAIKVPEPIEVNGQSTLMLTQAKPTQGPNMGYLGIALQNAFYELMTGASFEQSLVNIIQRGGDTDTNGCIAGALLGAYYGFSAIPNDWVNTVINVKPMSRLADYPDAHTDDLAKLALQLSKKVSQPT